MKTSEGFAPARPRLPAMGRALALVALALTGLAACEGDNLFSGDGPSFQPRVLSIGLPDAAFADDTVTIRIDAVAARQVSQIIVSTRGAVSRDTVIDVDDELQQVSAVVKVGIPAVLQDTLLIVEAQISDAAGARSVTKQAVTPAFGPPTVQTVGTPGAVRAGEVATLRITAFGARRISRIDVQARGAFTKDTSITVAPARSSVTQDVLLSIPVSVTDTILNLSVTAHDEVGFMSEPEVAMVPFIIDPPSIAIIAPPSVQPGSPLNVEVQAQALRKITQLRLELSGGLNPVVVPINPAQTNVNRFVSIDIPGDFQESEIQLVAYAIDRAGDESITPAQNIAVPSGAPIVLTVDAPSTATGGHLVDVRVNATGTRPIKEVRVRWRGFLADSLTVPETVASITPPRANVSADFSVRVPCYSTSKTLLILVTATDEADQISPVASGVVTVTGNAECVAPDDTATTPSMRLRRLPGLDSGGNAPLSFGSGADPFVRTTATSSRRGRRRRA